MLRPLQTGPLPELEAPRVTEMVSPRSAPLDLQASLRAPSQIPALKPVIGAAAEMPDENVPPAQPPSLPSTLRPLVTSPRAQQEARLQAGIDAFEHPDPAKPGFWHKLGRVAAKAGNIAGDVLAPGAMVLAPGTDLHRALNAAAERNELGRLQAQDQAEQDAFSRRTVEGAQAEEARARTDAIKHAEEAPVSWTHLATDKGFFAVNPKTNEVVPLAYNGDTLMPAAKPQNDPHDAFHEWLANPEQYKAFLQDMSTGKSMRGAYGSFGPAFLAYHMLNTAYRDNPALLPALAPMLAKMFSSAGAGNGNEIGDVLAQVPAGQPRDAAGNAVGLSQPAAPTGQTRSRGQFAQAVIPSIADARAEIHNLAGDLGPVQGRWYELYTGKIGAFGPRFSGLQTTLKNIGTAWMRLHANSETARKEFEESLRGAQSPANLIANLDSIDKQARDYVLEGEGRPDKLQGSGAHRAKPGYILVQIPGQAVGEIPAKNKAAFLKKYPNGKVF